VFAAALGLLPITAASLRLVGLKRTLAALETVVPARLRRLAPDEERWRAYKTAALVRAAARRSLTGRSCLPTSLTVWTLLRAQGVRADIRIGARLREGHFDAHAWVEWNGVALEPADNSSQPFAAFGVRLASDELEPR
jgi:hypothetical protein